MNRALNRSSHSTLFDQQPDCMFIFLNSSFTVPCILHTPRVKLFNAHFYQYCFSIHLNRRTQSCAEERLQRQLIHQQEGVSQSLKITVLAFYLLSLTYASTRIFYIHRLLFTRYYRFMVSCRPRHIY